MTTYVHVALFAVSKSEETQPLSNTLTEYAALPLERRSRSDVRLDTIKFEKADDQLPADVYHLDFSKSRDIGPGKMSSAEEVSDIDLGDNELFGEETAALYVPHRKWLLVLKNHFGVGSSRMQAYFNALDPGNNARFFDYALLPMIDRTALDRMKAIKQFSSVEVTASVGAFDCGDQLGESVHQAAKSATAHRVHLKLFANEKHHKGGVLDFKAVRGFVDKFIKNGDDVDKLEVKSADTLADAQDRVIDLIEHKVSRSYRATELDIRNHRYTYESKIRLLRRACKGWMDTIG